MQHTDDKPEIFSFADAWAYAAGKFNNTAQGRKDRHRKTANAINKRSLNASGRLSQFNFRVREDLKVRVHELADAAGIPVAVWMQAAIEAHIQHVEKNGGTTS